MFRIKNLRNSTVAKQTNILPSINNDLRQPLLNKGKINPEVKHQQRQPSRSRARNIFPQKHTESKIHEHKLIAPNTPHKAVLVSKAHRQDLTLGKKMIRPGLHHKLLASTNQSIVDKNKQSVKNIQIGRQEEKPESKQEKDHKEVEAVHMPESNLQSKSKEIKMKDAQEDDFMKYVREQEQLKKKESEQMKMEEIKIEQLRKEKQMKQQEEKNKEQEKKRKEMEMDAFREKEMSEMMQKIYARRKAREEQKQRRLARQQARKKQNSSSIQGIAGLVSLKDPLAHIEMSQALMDRQIEHVLKMNFSAYPIKEAIENQIDQLDRINQSYLMVRDDPDNPIASGLANFRIELFNRIGEMVMVSQGQMGECASGLQIVQADNLNGNILDIKITRGLEGHIHRFIRTKRVQSEEECAICLGIMNKNEQIYEVNCGHQFHKKCLEDWLLTTANCPSCRYNIKMDHP